MKRIIILVLSALVIHQAYTQERLTDHVVLISIDGFRPDFYLEPQWPAPTLKWMAERGAKAEGVRGVFPSVTYPSHTTLITGEKPGTHGIYYNSPFEPDGQTGAWYWYEKDIKTATLWDAVRAKGLKSASFIWPVTVGAPIDYNIPEFWSLESGHGRIEPMRSEETPKGFLAEMEREVLGKMNNTTFNGDYFNREDRTGEMAAYVLEKYKPNFIALHLIGTDHFQHVGGRNGEKVPFAVAAADRAIAKIKEAAERAGVLDRTTFIITGDHGFVDVHSRLSPNVWLTKAGLRGAGKDRGDWKAAFHTSGASAWLHLKDPNDQNTLQQVRKLLQDLPAKTRKLFRVVERDELKETGADPNAALAIAPVPGVAMSGAASGSDLRSGRGGTHGFFPDFDEIETGFVAFGAGIQSGKYIHEMGLEDIAPLIAHLLSLNFEVGAGVLYPGIVKE